MQQRNYFNNFHGFCQRWAHLRPILSHLVNEAGNKYAMFFCHTLNTCLFSILSIPLPHTLYKHTKYCIHTHINRVCALMKWWPPAAYMPIRLHIFICIGNSFAVRDPLPVAAARHTFGVCAANGCGCLNHQQSIVDSKERECSISAANLFVERCGVHIVRVLMDRPPAHVRAPAVSTKLTAKIRFDFEISAFQ